MLKGLKNNVQMGNMVCMNSKHLTHFFKKAYQIVKKVYQMHILIT